MGETGGGWEGGIERVSTGREIGGKGMLVLPGKQAGGRKGVEAWRKSGRMGVREGDSHEKTARTKEGQE